MQISEINRKLNSLAQYPGWVHDSILVAVNPRDIENPPVLQAAPFPATGNGSVSRLLQSYCPCGIDVLQTKAILDAITFCGLFGLMQWCDWCRGWQMNCDDCESLFCTCGSCGEIWVEKAVIFLCCALLSCVCNLVGRWEIGLATSGIRVILLAGIGHQLSFEWINRHSPDFFVVQYFVMTTGIIDALAMVALIIDRLSGQDSSSSTSGASAKTMSMHFSPHGSVIVSKCVPIASAKVSAMNPRNVRSLRDRAGSHVMICGDGVDETSGW